MGDGAGVALTLEADLGVVDRPRGIGQQDEPRSTVSAAAYPPSMLIKATVATVSRRIPAPELQTSTIVASVSSSTPAIDIALVIAGARATAWKARAAAGPEEGELPRLGSVSSDAIIKP